MSLATYDERRGRLETYFDATAMEAWAQLTSDAPVNSIRVPGPRGAEPSQARTPTMASGALPA